MTQNVTEELRDRGRVDREVETGRERLRDRKSEAERQKERGTERWIERVGEKRDRHKCELQLNTVESNTCTDLTVRYCHKPGQSCSDPCPSISLVRESHRK